MFPLGITQYAVGGLLVGLGIALIFLTTGRVSGVSTAFTSTWSYIVRAHNSFFARERFVSSRNWRVVLVLGIALGGALHTIFVEQGATPTTSVPLWALFVGGILVGVGSRMGTGCPSGHGICGNAMLQKQSLVSTLVFLVVAIVVATLTKQII